jgi:hypothetical protein
MPGEIAGTAPRPLFGAAQAAGGHPHLVSVLQKGRENANIHASLKVIWGPAKWN